MKAKDNKKRKRPANVVKFPGEYKTREAEPMDGSDRRKAEQTLAHIREDVYNITRPDSTVIGELVGVIRFLDERVRTLEKKRPIRQR